MTNLIRNTGWYGSVLALCWTMSCLSMYSDRIVSEAIPTEDLDDLQRELAQELQPPSQRASIIAKERGSGDGSSASSRQKDSGGAQPIVSPRTAPMSYNERLKRTVNGAVGKAGFKSFGTPPPSTDSSKTPARFEPLDEEPPSKPAPVPPQRKDAPRKSPRQLPAASFDEEGIASLLEGGQCADRDASSLSEVYDEEFQTEEGRGLYTTAIEGVPFIEPQAPSKPKVVIHRQPAPEVPLVRSNSGKSSVRRGRPASQESTEQVSPRPETVTLGAKKTTLTVDPKDKDRRAAKAYNMYRLTCSGEGKQVKLTWPASFEEFIEKMKAYCAEHAIDRDIDQERADQNTKLVEDDYLSWLFQNM